MTTPEERTQAVMQTKRFLEQLCFDGSTSYEVPEEIRRTARRLLKHYPGAAHLDQAAVAWPSSWTAVRGEGAQTDQHAPSYLELLARLRELGQLPSFDEDTHSSEWQVGTVTRLSRRGGFGYVRSSAGGEPYIFSVHRALGPSEAHRIRVGRRVRFRVSVAGRVVELASDQEGDGASDEHA